MYFLIITWFLYQTINCINNNNILNLFFFNLKLHIFFKIRSKNYTPKDDNFNLFFIRNNFSNKLVNNYILEKKPFNFDKFSFFIFRNYLYFYFYKQYFFNNILINYFFKSYYFNRMSNLTLNNFFLFNCCFYNFYIENLFFFYKLLANDRNHFFWFFIRTFKKKKKKKLKKKRKKKIFRFRFRKRRFKFKRFRKHTKSFKLKKRKLKKENYYNSNLIFYYNFISKINNIKKIKNKKLHKPQWVECFLEKNFLKKIVIFQNCNLKYFKYFDKSIKKKVFFKKIFKHLNLKSNLKRLKYRFFKFKFKLKKFKKYKYIKILHNIFNFLIKSFIFYGFFYPLFLKIKINFWIGGLIDRLDRFFFFKKKKQILKKKRRSKKRKKRWFFYKNKFFKKKKKYRYRVRSLFYKKNNLKRYSPNKYNPALFKEFYKTIFQKLLTNFKIKPSIFMVNNFSKYNIYNFNKLYNDKYSLIKYINKNYRFFKLTKNDTTNSITVYNNHTPIYILNKNYIKKFRKIFKSYLSKRYNNHMYYYIIPMFEYFFKKNIFIKSFNLNIYKKGKHKKKKFYKKLIKIFKKNKSLVISRSINFNIFEFCEIVLYSFYKKDAYLILNWFLRNFKNTHFTGHKSFLTFFKMVINDIFESYKNTLRIKGFYFIIKGKVGVTSNAKKKTVKFVIGSLNKSTKSQKIDFQQSVVKSISGSLGVSIILTY